MKRRRELAVKYSPQEQTLLKLIPLNGKRTTTAELTAGLYRGEKELPLNARGVVNSTLSNLIEKIERNGENFVIVKGKRRGPNPDGIEVWVEKKQPKRRTA